MNQVSSTVPPRGDWPIGGMIEQQRPADKGLSPVCADLSRRVRGYLDQVADARARWLFHEQPPACGDGSSDAENVETLAWAVTCLTQIGSIDRLNAIGPAAVAAIEGFFDPQLELYQRAEDQYKPVGSWRLHNDSVCRDALRMLGATPRPWPRDDRLLEQMPWAPAADEDVHAWCKTRWRRGPRRATKELFQFLVLALGRHHVGPGDPWLADALAAYRFLEDKRDPRTGLIGMGDGVRCGDAMRGYRNMVINIHWPHGIDEPAWALPRLIDTTLATQRDDGLFDDGGMCANMDAVQLLVEYALRTGHRKDDVRSAIDRCTTAIVRDLSHPSGGIHFLHPQNAEPDHSLRLTNGTAFWLHTLRFAQAMH